MTATATIAQRPTGMHRAYTATMLEPKRIDREARVIRGYAVITRGEALGHDMWIDGAFLDQVVTAGNQATRGVKCRFTHPDLCNDGLGTFLGRAKSFRRDGNIVRADLHFSGSTSESPRFTRDPGDYIISLAADDAQAFATSIVFYHDVGAEDRFIADHEDAEGRFRSPDSDNIYNYFHARLASLVASDIVDEPAANPGGFLGAGQERAAVATVAAEYLFGLSETPPPPGAFGTIEPERARDFVARFMASHNLSLQSTSSTLSTPSITEREEAMPHDTPDVPVVPEELVVADEDEFDLEILDCDEPATVAQLREAFPGENDFILDCLADEMTLAEAHEAHAPVVAAELAAARAEIAALKARLADLTGENTDIRAKVLAGSAGVAHQPEPQNVPFMQLVDAYQKEHPEVSGEDAVRKTIELQPEAYAAYRRELGLEG